MWTKINVGDIKMHGNDHCDYFSLPSASASFPLCCADESTKDELVLSTRWVIIGIGIVYFL